MVLVSLGAHVVPPLEVEPAASARGLACSRLSVGETDVVGNLGVQIDIHARLPIAAASSAAIYKVDPGRSKTYVRPTLSPASICNGRRRPHNSGPAPVEDRARSGLSVEGERALRAPTAFGRMEDPVLPRREAPVDLAVERSRDPAKRRLASMPVRESGLKADARSSMAMTQLVVLEVDLVQGLGHQPQRRTASCGS